MPSGLTDMQAWLARLPSWTEIALVLLAAWLVTGWLVGNQGESLPEFEVREDTGASALPDVAALVNVPLFGRVARQVTAKPSAVSKPVLQSRLNIKLLGTVVAGKHSAAIVKLAAEREQNVFFKGDTMQPGVKLHDVEPEAVIVERAGKLERIMMEEGAALAGPITNRSAAATAARPSISRRVNRKQLQSQIRDFPKLLSQARVIPHFTNGKADGFTISNIVPGSLYTQVGLRNGDIIRKVNGRQVTSAEQAMAMYHALQSAPSIDVELMRGGQVHNVHYDIR